MPGGEGRIGGIGDVRGEVGESFFGHRFWNHLKGVMPFHLDEAVKSGEGRRHRHHAERDEKIARRINGTFGCDRKKHAIWSTLA